MLAHMGLWSGTAPPRWEVTAVSETGSTNADLLAAARAGAPEGRVLVADHQSAGRGRLARSWDAPAGSALLVSILLRPSLPIDHLHQVTQAVALAARRACDATSGVTPGLKWPNDLVIDDLKLAGVLAETTTDPADGPAVVVGVGLNIAWPDGPPPGREGQAVSLDMASGRVVDRDDLLACLLESLGAIDERRLLADYRAALVTLGRRVRVELPGDVIIVGTATDVGVDGALLVDTTSDRVWVRAGDVVHLRPGE
jgi:BirA family biotin operon repressor/biotin-[acetyl-CoA-carboxylase] ligase